MICSIFALFSIFGRAKKKKTFSGTDVQTNQSEDVGKLEARKLANQIKSKSNVFFSGTIYTLTKEQSFTRNKYTSKYIHIHLYSSRFPKSICTCPGMDGGNPRDYQSPPTPRARKVSQWHMVIFIKLGSKMYNYDMRLNTEFPPRRTSPIGFKHQSNHCVTQFILMEDVSWRATI